MRPYCTYNVFRENPGDVRLFRHEPDLDSNGASFAPPFPVSVETHIAWHTNVIPAFPFHPVPLTRTLASEEMDDLGRRVICLLGEKEEHFGDAKAVLRNDYKFHILAVLAEMDLLQRATSAIPMSAGSFRSAS